MAGLGVAFLLLALLVQVATATTARHVARAAVTAASRDAALPEADIGSIRSATVDGITRTVPGARNVAVTIRLRSRRAEVTARFGWVPPGPILIPIEIRVSSSTALVVPP